MNIFFLDWDEKKNAQSYCDKHVCKIIVEIAQMLSAGAHIYNSKLKDKVYKPTHLNHPMTKWVNENNVNYKYTISLFFELLEEYTHRYNKIHKCSKLKNYFVMIYLDNIPKANNDLVEINPPLCMPEKYKCKDYVKAYRNYYNGEKLSFCTYKNRTPPKWFKVK